MRQRLIDLANQRTAQLAAAEAALAAGNHAEYTSAMEKVQNLNTEIQNIQNLLAEQERRVLEQPGPSGGEARDMAEERGAALARGDSFNFSVNEIRRFLVTNQVTLSTGTIVQPSGAGSEIRDPLGNIVPSIVDRVHAVDLTGMGSWSEPYVISEIDANTGKVETLSGTARTASTDPVFGVAEIRPYEMNTTSFVDRNIARLSPANYYDKVAGMAMRAMRRKLSQLIINGDGAASPIFHGITTAKNKSGANIYATVELASLLGIDTLDDLYFAYGGDEAIGGAARLLLTKPNLKGFGKIRGTNEKKRLYTITPEPGNANSGVIQDGGMILPFDLTKAVGDDKLLYGDPHNFELGLFGEYSVRIDESVKAVERMVAILGDAMVGGNLVVDKGFVVGSVAAAASTEGQD